MQSILLTVRLLLQSLNSFLCSQAAGPLITNYTDMILLYVSKITNKNLAVAVMD